jgi:hypothetical protein
MTEAMPVHDVARLAGADPAQLRAALLALGVRGVAARVHPGLVPLALHLDPVRWHLAVADDAIRRLESSGMPTPASPAPSMVPCFKVRPALAVPPTIPRALALVPGIHS